MSKVRVPVYGSPLKGIYLNPDATDGATVGINLFWGDGTVVTKADFGGTNVPSEPGPVISAWSLILDIPPNVIALAETATTGIYVITGIGSSATREIEIASGELTVANGDGVAGNPTLGLADVPDGGGGTLQKTAFDGKGRRTDTSTATTDDLPEGVSNLYFTVARALAVLNLDADAEPNSPASLDDLQGTLYFSFNQSTPGAPPIPGSYDAIGYQIGNGLQRTQVVTAGRIIRTRTDDGDGWTAWYSLSMTSTGASGSEILVTGEVGPVALTTNDETDWLYTS